MKLFSLIVFNSQNAEKPLILARAEELGMFGFWKRGTIREIITFVSRQLVSKTAPAQRQVASHDMAEPQDGINRYLRVTILLQPWISLISSDCCVMPSYRLVDYRT